jgi:uncharacterized protein (TIGR03790 family)
MNWMKSTFILLSAVICSSSLAAQDYHHLPLNDRVLVVYNSWTKDSKSVAQYYVAERSIPKANLCELKIDDRESQNYTNITRADLDKKVKAPIKKCLQRVGEKKILYIVLTYETPYVIAHELKGFGLAIDSYIADIWGDGADARVDNPYNLIVHGRGLPPPYIPFSDYRDKKEAKVIYSVWRLDGSTASAAKKLVDQAIQAETEGLRGQVCIDRRDEELISRIPESGYGMGEWALQRAADASVKAGFNVLEDTHFAEFGTAPATLRCDKAALFAGWYALGHYNDAFSWNVGAIGIHLDSASALSPREGESWAANALKKGITVTAGAVEEPYLQGLPSPDVIFSALYDGANVGDAFMRGERWLKWMIINIGDPLYRPFPDGKRPAQSNSK